jgi:hypothetical protein
MRVCRGEVEFLEAIDCSQKDWREEEEEADVLPEPPEKTGKFIADTICAAIKRLGGSYPVAIIMDNASACALAGRELEEMLPGTFAICCASHPTQSSSIRRACCRTLSTSTAGKKW